MRVAALQIAYHDDEPIPVRVDRVAQLVREVASTRGGVDVVVLPELWAPTGFGYRGWEAAAETMQGEWVQAMVALAAETGITLHAGSFIERLDQPGPEGRHLANTSVLVTAQGELTAYRKIHRFGFAGGEPRLLEAGRQLVTATIPGGGAESVTVGLSTCYDLRFPELYRDLIDRGATMFIIPAAWPAARVAAWTVLGQARAIENQTFVVQCNTAGTHAGTQMGGRSQIVGPDGVVLDEAGDGEEVLVADLEVGAVAKVREAFPVLDDRRTARGS